MQSIWSTDYFEGDDHLNEATEYESVLARGRELIATKDQWESDDKERRANRRDVKECGRFAEKRFTRFVRREIYINKDLGK